MLVVHPSSQCDVCLDAYTWSTPAKSPHAIQCGHIFCYDCLRTVNPSNCPMCRKAFNPERIKKLHVDKAPGEGSVPTGPMAEENELLRRVGMLFDQDADPVDIDAIVEEATEWLNNHPGPAVSHPALIFPVATRDVRKIDLTWHRLFFSTLRCGTLCSPYMKSSRFASKKLPIERCSNVCV
ncbi:hypothetical protein DICSQDRAFT_55259 [Dichomitus squalens LYAD-421 SS1]|uniref:uncharacterized protein n=1 Tax=Dichomitus squalens (strain LYAD-421) TaxID=732165 RepID=UPI00044135A9|nr:uncharacterized protein DICSQDRAFT_55259 [Dichomitus squalens LYAD-421 SS1]EJF63667.1 hypothetical protein DICSQDRAFT_55259 [Dichomitus squalens LYAD-421 SS1]